MCPLEYPLIRGGATTDTVIARNGRYSAAFGYDWSQVVIKELGTHYTTYNLYMSSTISLPLVAFLEPAIKGQISEPVQGTDDFLDLLI